MWRIDDQLTTFFDNSSELVTGLAAHPQLVVVLVEQGDDSLVFAARVLDVKLAADVGGPPKGFPNVAGEERMRPQTIVVVARDYGVERDDMGGNKVRGCLNHVARRRFDATNHVFDRSQRAKPVRRMRQVWASDAGEEIFRASGKTCNLVRHSRAKDKHRIVNSWSQQTIEIH